MGFDIPWVGGLIYYVWECHNSMGRGSMHHGYGGKITMGKGFDVTSVGFQNTMGIFFVPTYPWYTKPLPMVF